MSNKELQGVYQRNQEMIEILKTDPNCSTEVFFKEQWKVLLVTNWTCQMNKKSAEVNKQNFCYFFFHPTCHFRFYNRDVR